MLSWGFTGAAQAAKKCKRGAVAVKIEGKKGCSKAAALGTIKPGAEPAVTVLDEALLSDGWMKPLKRFRAKAPVALIARGNPKLPKKILQGVKLLIPKLRRAADAKVPGLARRATTSAGAPAGVTFDPGSGRIAATGSYDAGGGVTATATVSGTIGGKDGVEIDVDQDRAKNGVKQSSFGIGVTAKGKVDQCPTAGGVVQGDFTSRARMSTSVGAESASFKTESKAKTKGQTEDDASLAKIEVSEVETVNFSLQGIGGHVVINRTTTIDAKTGATSGSTAKADATLDLPKKIFSFLEPTAEERATAEADLAGTMLERMGKETSQAILSKVLEDHRAAEKNWRTENKCATAKVEPGPPEKVKQGDKGKIGASVTAASGEGAVGRWTVTPTKVTVDPTSGSSPAGGTLDVNYTVGAVRDKETVEAGFRVTSKAGIATASWKSTAEDEGIYIKAELLSYATEHTGEASDFCTITGESEEKAAIVPPFEGNDDSRFHSSGDGTQRILLIFETPVERKSSFVGCKPEPGFPPCPVGPLTHNFSYPLGAVVDLPESGDAELTWYTTPAFIGPVEPSGSCLVGSLYANEIPIREATTPRSSFLDPGEHTISYTRTDSYTEYNIEGEAVISMKIRRVNADGSPYTGAK
ncbi:MAG TPA: hypothetical protein VIT85_03135 [Solirubrobacterales bacterium]